MSRGFLAFSTGTNGAWTVKFVIKTVLSKVRKLHSYLSEQFHSILVAFSAKGFFRANYRIDTFLKIFEGRGVFYIFLKRIPFIDAVREETVLVSLSFGNWSFRNKTA